MQRYLREPCSEAFHRLQHTVGGDVPTLQAGHAIHARPPVAAGTPTAPGWLEVGPAYGGLARHIIPLVGTTDGVVAGIAVATEVGAGEVPVGTAVTD